MKKIMMFALVLVSAIVSNASMVKWGYTGTASDEGSKIYVFATPVAGTYDTVADLIANSIDSGTVVAKSNRGNMSYVVAAQTITSDAIVKGVTDTLYFAVVSGDSYKYGSLSAASNVYDETDPPGAQMNVTSAMLSNSGTIGGSVPEPTTGLLILLGMAGLALKRKIA